MADKNAERERILVCVSASPTSSNVIRRAARLSRAIGAELIALYVEDSETQDDAQDKAVHEHLDLAERQGAILTTIYGNDPATAIAQYARVSGITKIVLGKSPERRSFLVPRETLMSRLNELAPDVEIVIVPNRLHEDSRRGIGLGLALCRSIVQAHGGEIRMESVRPHGARFWFTLPIAEVKEYEQ